MYNIVYIKSAWCFLVADYLIKVMKQRNDGSVTDEEYLDEALLMETQDDCEGEDVHASGCSSEINQGKINK